MKLRSCLVLLLITILITTTAYAKDVYFTEYQIGFSIPDNCYTLYRDMSKQDLYAAKPLLLLLVEQTEEFKGYNPEKIVDSIINDSNAISFINQLIDGTGEKTHALILAEDNSVVLKLEANTLNYLDYMQLNDPLKLATEACLEAISQNNNTKYTIQEHKQNRNGVEYYTVKIYTIPQAYTATFNDENVFFSFIMSPVTAENETLLSSIMESIYFSENPHKSTVTTSPVANFEQKTNDTAINNGSVSTNGNILDSIWRFISKYISFSITSDIVFFILGGAVLLIGSVISVLISIFKKK